MGRPDVCCSAGACGKGAASNTVGLAYRVSAPPAEASAEAQEGVRLDGGSLADAGLRVRGQVVLAL